MAVIPYRADDPVTGWLLIKIILILVALLAAAYALLAFVARRRQGHGRTEAMPALQCVRALRISPRTKVFVVQVGARQFLLSESTANIKIEPLENASALLPEASERDGHD